MLVWKVRFLSLTLKQGENTMTSAKERPFTQFAAKLLFGDEGVTSLNRGDCPCCSKPITEFRDALSRKEYAISGMCQECRDSVFA